MGVGTMGAGKQATEPIDQYPLNNGKQDRNGQQQQLGDIGLASPLATAWHQKADQQQRQRTVDNEQRRGDEGCRSSIQAAVSRSKPAPAAQAITFNGITTLNSRVVANPTIDSTINSSVQLLSDSSSVSAPILV